MTDTTRSPAPPSPPPPWAPAAGPRAAPPPERSLLAAHLPFLWERAAEILGRPELCFCAPAEAGLALMHLEHPPPTLGALLTCWRAGALVIPCPACRGRLLVFRLGGSPLSGTHALAGACLDCGRPDYKAPNESRAGYGSFADLYLPLTRALAAHENRVVVRPGERRRFSYGQGLAGRRTPDTVDRLAVEPLPLAAVLDVLRGGAGAVDVCDADGGARFRVAWSPRRLTRLASSQSLTLLERALVDEHGVTRYLFDGLYLRRPDGTPLTEVDSRFPVHPPGLQLVSDRGAPDRLAHGLSVSSFITAFDGPRLAAVSPRGLGTPAGDLRNSWDTPIPAAFVQLLSWELGGGEAAW